MSNPINSTRNKNKTNALKKEKKIFSKLSLTFILCYLVCVLSDYHTSGS